MANQPFVRNRPRLLPNSGNNAK